MNTRWSTGFIGAGRVTRLLLEGWKAGGGLPGRVRVADCDAEKLASLREDFPDVEPVSAVEAAACDLVVLAVHPPVLPEVFGLIRPRIGAKAAVLSLAPKVKCATIAAELGVGRVARMIPNAPSAIGKGFNPVAFAPGFDSAAKVVLLAMVAAWGDAPEVAEADLEAYALLSAMGPTYFWFQWQALRELGREFGLSPQAADRAILRMSVGAVECLMSPDREPAAVMDMVPVKPLAGAEDGIRAVYREALTSLYQKLKS